MKKQHLWIFANHQDAIPIDFKYVHIGDGELILPPLEKPYLWTMEWEDCECGI